MKCQECREELAAYIEGLLDETRQNRMDSHMAECTGCQAELQQTRELTDRLTREGLAVSPVCMQTAVMDRILQEQALTIRRLKMRKRIRVLGTSGAAAVAAAMLFVGGLWLTEPAEAQKAAAVLARGAEAVPNPSTVHIVAKVRTPPHDNFSSIGANFDLVPVEVWKQFGEKPKWRVEKSGRVAAMDGTSTMMLIRPNVGLKLPLVSQSAFDTHWLLSLMNVQDLLSRELATAQAKGWKLKKTEETTADGKKQLVVSVEAKADVSKKDYSRDKWFDSTDMRRVYRFDAETQRLEGFEAHMHCPDGDVLVAVIDHIEYDKPIDTKVFSIDFPKDVNWYEEPKRLADNEKYEKMTPEQAARAFFEACGKKDWKEVAKFYSPLDERIKDYLGGMEIMSLGKPFKSEKYPGWHVPYEIKCNMKAPFQVCYDNPAKRCIVFFPRKTPSAELLAQVKPLEDNEKYQKMTPKQAVQAYLKAYNEKNAEEFRKFTYESVPVEEIKKALTAGPTFEEFTVGEPIKAEQPGRWTVPVEIRIVRKHNLAIRKDNPAKRFMVDGGL
ncbi:MAG: zf-HC2 domain-containing protein [Pirellulales bacterium]|nr:zf-HC2 domain-containing protein [Pirellulales bacterium]